jgi:tetratricopeptide (TPR) repeat protein
LEDVNEAERKEIMHAIVEAFNKYAKRYNERFNKELESKTAEEKRQLQETFKKVDLLLSKRAFFPGFSRYVLKKVMNNQRLMRHRKVLVNAFVISIINPEGFRIKDIQERTEEKASVMKEGEPNKAYTRRTDQQILNERWRDAFFKPEELSNDSTMDDRFKPSSSVFATAKPPSTSHSYLTDEQYEVLFNYPLSNEQMMEWLTYSATTQTVTPEVLTDQLLLRQESLKVITFEMQKIAQELRKVRKEYQKEKLREREKRAKFFQSEVENFTPIFLEFYFHFASLLAWEWLRSRRPENVKSLLARGFPLRFTSTDIVKARKLMLSQTHSEDHADSLLRTALREYSFAEKSFLRYRQCLEASGLSEEDCGIVLENIAIVHRNSKNYKLMRLYLKNALQHYEKSGVAYRVCVALKNMGEAEWYMGFKNKALKYFAQSENRSITLNDPIQHFKVLGNLVAASKRIGDFKLQRKYLMKCLTTCPQEDTEMILQIENQLQQLDKYFN